MSQQVGCPVLCTAEPGPTGLLPRGFWGLPPQFKDPGTYRAVLSLPQHWTGCQVPTPPRAPNVFQEPRCPLCPGAWGPLLRPLRHPSTSFPPLGSCRAGPWGLCRGPSPHTAGGGRHTLRPQKPPGTHCLSTLWSCGTCPVVQRADGAAEAWAPQSPHRFRGAIAQGVGCILAGTSCPDHTL